MISIWSRKWKKSTLRRALLINLSLFKKSTKNNTKNLTNPTSQGNPRENLKENITKNLSLLKEPVVILRTSAVLFVQNQFVEKTIFGLVHAAICLYTWSVSRHGFLTSIRTKIKMRFFLIGAVLNVNFNIMSHCLNIIATVESF